MENCTTIIWIKNGLYIPAFLIAIGIPEQTSWSIYALSTLMIIDFVTGILASYKIDGRESITSRRMTMGAVAKALILLIPFILILGAKGVGIDIASFLQGFVSILILSEIYSSVGNIHSFKTGKRNPEIDAISIILKKIRDLLLSLFDKAKAE